jgi:ABC-2 type transport system permease protein
MHNLGTVFRFEVKRTLKKRSFWIMAAMFPLLIGLIFAIAFFSNKASNKAAEETKNQKFSIVITDESSRLNKALIQAVGATETSDKQAAIQQVETGTLDAYFYFPKDLVKDKVEIYAKDAGLFNDGRYQAVAKAMLQQSVAAKVDPATIAALQDKVNFTAVTYKDGAPYDGFKALIAPGIFLVLFYILIAMFGNQMLASTTEEKENRVIEMILTTIKARTLIIGKILSLLVLALIQVAVILVPIVIIYLFFQQTLSLPNVDLSNIPIDPVRVALGAAIFVFSFLLFTGLLVAIGAAVPTAKEAAGFFGVVMVLLFGPLYAVTLFISTPNAGIVQFLSYFPLTAPIPLMLRNAVGNLPVTDALLGITILAVCAFLALVVAVRMFQYGALEYSRRISFAVLFRKKG